MTKYHDSKDIILTQRKTSQNAKSSFQKSFCFYCPEYLKELFVLRNSSQCSNPQSFISDHKTLSFYFKPK